MSEPEQPLVLPDIQSAVTENEAYALTDLARGKTVLELGAWTGFSTVVLASVAERVTSVDWHQGDDHAGRIDTWESFTANLARYGVAGRVEVIRGRFENELPVLAGHGRQFDGCFLDAQHDYDSVVRDVGLALPLLKPGAFFAFHDYGRSAETGNAGFEVTRAADELIVIAGRTGFLGWGFTRKKA